MKKLIVILLVLTCILSLITACSNNSTLEFSFESKELYTGFQNLAQTYSLKNAEKDACVVIQEFKVVENKKVWDKFVKAANRGTNASVRIVGFNNDGEAQYFIDLFYNDGAYYLFDSSAESLEKQPFEYLLTLEGQYGDSLQDGTFIILTNKNTYTFDDIYAMSSHGGMGNFGIGLIMFLKD